MLVVDSVILGRSHERASRQSRSEAGGLNAIHQMKQLYSMSDTIIIQRRTYESFTVVPQLSCIYGLIDVYVSSGSIQKF